MPSSAPGLAAGDAADLSQHIGFLARLAAEGNEGLLVVDPQGCCQFINDLAARLAGGTPSELSVLAAGAYLARLCERCQHGDTGWLDMAGSPDIAAMAASRRWLRFTCFTGGDGLAGQARQYALVPYALRNASGTLIGYALFLRDMTPPLQDDALENSLLSSVSHDLRTPLMVIKAAVTGLLQEGLDWDEGLRREMLQDINEETDRLTTLVSALLEMSRIQGGALQLQTEWCDLAEIIHTVLDRLQKITRQHCMVYDVHVPLPLIQGDFTQLDRVLSNLIENAVKYSPEKTEIRITAHPGETEVEVSVSDEGCGVAPEERERIFEKFYRVKQRQVHLASGGCNTSVQQGQAGRSAPSLAGGSGLGLAICRGIIGAHHGRIWVEGRAGGGSRFVFTLPVEPSAPKSGSVFRESGPLAQQAPDTAVLGPETGTSPVPGADWEENEETDGIG